MRLDRDGRPLIVAPSRTLVAGGAALEREAERLAGQPIARSAQTGHALSPRLGDTARALLDRYRALAPTIRQKGTTSPAAEWFVENFPMVDNALQDVRSDLPRGFYQKLPVAAEGPFAGYPRVFELMHAFVAHRDGRFDSSTLR